MAVRIREDGRVLCAAMHLAEIGDIYVDDGLHYYLSCEAKVLVTEPHDRHEKRGEWWWITRVPADVQIEEFYLQPLPQSQHIAAVLREVSPKGDIAFRTENVADVVAEGYPDLPMFRLGAEPITRPRRKLSRREQEIEKRRRSDPTGQDRDDIDYSSIEDPEVR